MSEEAGAWASNERVHQRQLAAALLAQWVADLDAARPAVLSAPLFAALLHAYSHSGQILQVLQLMRQAFGCQLSVETSAVLGIPPAAVTARPAAVAAAAGAAAAGGNGADALDAALSSQGGGSSAEAAPLPPAATVEPGGSSRGGGARRAAGSFALLQQQTLERAQLAPSLPIFNAAIGACTRVGTRHMADAVALLRSMLVRCAGEGCCAGGAACGSPSVQCNRALPSTHATFTRCRSWPALPTQACGLAPDVHTYTSLIAGCAYGRQAALARELLRQMRERGIQPSTWTHNALIKVRAGVRWGARMCAVGFGGERGAGSAAHASQGKGEGVQLSKPTGAARAGRPCLQVECWTYGVDAGTALLRQLVQQQGMEPDAATWSTLLACEGACGSGGGGGGGRGRAWVAGAAGHTADLAACSSPPTQLMPAQPPSTTSGEMWRRWHWSSSRGGGAARRRRRTRRQRRRRMRLMRLMGQRGSLPERRTITGGTAISSSRKRTMSGERLFVLLLCPSPTVLSCCAEPRFVQRLNWCGGQAWPHAWLSHHTRAGRVSREASMAEIAAQRDEAGSRKARGGGACAAQRVAAGGQLRACKPSLLSVVDRAAASDC